MMLQNHKRECCKTGFYDHDEKQRVHFRIISIRYIFSFHLSDPIPPVMQSQVSLKSGDSITLTIDSPTKINKGVKTEIDCLIIYASGAIGAKGDSEHLEIVQGYLEEIMRSNPYLCDKERSESASSWIGISAAAVPKLSPAFKLKRRVKYRIEEFETIDQSSNSDLLHAQKIGRKIRDSYKNYDAFIVLVGTDTVCYIASLISFMFQNLSKPILFTSGNIPLCQMKSDSFNNILDSLSILTAHDEYNLCEVVVVNRFKVYRANRSTRINQGTLDSVGSPNYPSLIELRIQIGKQSSFDSNFPNSDVHEKLLLKKPAENHVLEYFDDFSDQIKIIRYHPLIRRDTLQYEIADPTVKAIIIQSYSAGSMPANPSILELFKSNFQTRKTIYLNISQCIHYPNDSDMKSFYQKYGIIHGGDMTVEAAVAKLAYLLGKKYSYEKIVELLRTDILGELTPVEEEKQQFQRKPESFMEIVEEPLPRDVFQNKLIIDKIIVPTITKAIAKNPNQHSKPMDLLKKYISINDHVTQSYKQVPGILHLAARSNNQAFCEHLIKKGVAVNSLDEHKRSPLYYALQNQNRKIVYDLKKADGRLICPKAEEAQLIFQNISRDNVDFLQMSVFVGIKGPMLQEIRDIENRNIGHYVAIFKSTKCLKFLKSKDINFRFTAIDQYHETAQQTAARLWGPEFAAMFR